MRKLTVIQTLPALNTGGVERGTIEVAAELVRRGHRSIVVCAAGELLPELLATGSEHIALPVGKKSLFTLRFIPRFRQIMRDTGANIIHARSRLPAWISYLAWRGLDPRTRPRFITSVHGPYTVNHYSKIMTAGERVIAVSEFIRNYIVDNYPDTPLDKIITIPRGVSKEHYPYRYRPDHAWLELWHKQYPALQNKTLITLPGRLTRWKQDFLHILTRLKDRNSDIHGLIVGGAQPGKRHYVDELDALVNKLGLRGRITFTGQRPDLKEIMSISTIIMSLSAEPEAFGRTALESLSLGVPVIGYDHGGTGEILEKIFPAGMITKHDVKAAAELILDFMKSPPLVPDKNPYTLQQMLDRTVGIYEELAVDGGRGP
jgi:glycosyltransferase involved in cell wall biosynthesis